MDMETALKYVIRPAEILLPPSQVNDRARAMLLAIAGQESGWEHRVQFVGGSRNWWESLKGPARGWWQFETAGVRGVLEHHTTRRLVERVVDRLHYPPRVSILHKALAYDSMLATFFARQLLYTVPERLPREDEADRAWNQYLSAWRPGKPHPERWAANFDGAWRVIRG